MSLRSAKPAGYAEYNPGETLSDSRNFLRLMIVHSSSLGPLEWAMDAAG